MKLKFLLFFTLLSAVASAQTESPTSKLTILSIDGRIMDLKYESVGAIETVYAFKNQRSEPFEYRGPQTVVFFRELSQTDENGNPLRLEVATCQLPTSGGQYLLIISKLEGEKEAYRAFPIEDNWDTFSAGTYRFLLLRSNSTRPFTRSRSSTSRTYREILKTIRTRQRSWSAYLMAKIRRLSLKDSCTIQRIRECSTLSVQNLGGAQVG